MAELSWRATKQFVYGRAAGCCEYCQTCEDNTGQSMHVEHILPNGENSTDNLCLACASCNFSKSNYVLGHDSESDTETALFNPRLQHWHDHFEWVDGGLRIHGKTSTGRATIARLKVNQPRVIRARRN